MKVSDNERFSKVVISTLAKRAANRCSNPDCCAVTSGPTLKAIGAVNVGEAAHIHGARPGSARYLENMTAYERSAITNAIWLCANCHKKIDDDPERYPAGLLFEWLRSHETTVNLAVGKTGTELRLRYEGRHLEELGKLSYLAERIVLEKPELWEFRLAAEVLRYEMAPILRRWRALKKSLYVLPSSDLDLSPSISWFQNRLAEAAALAEAFSNLTNHEFELAWGKPGQPGDEHAIIFTCRLFAEMCQSAVVWEETVRFTRVHQAFAEVHSLFVGAIGGLIDEAAKLPDALSKDLLKEAEGGEYGVSLTLSLPPNWAEDVNAALSRSWAWLEEND